MKQFFCLLFLTTVWASCSADFALKSAQNETVLSIPAASGNAEFTRAVEAPDFVASGVSLKEAILELQQHSILNLKTQHYCGGSTSVSGTTPTVLTLLETNFTAPGGNYNTIKAELNVGTIEFKNCACHFNFGWSLNGAGYGQQTKMLYKSDAGQMDLPLNHQVLIERATLVAGVNTLSFQVAAGSLNSGILEFPKAGGQMCPLLSITAFNN